MDPRLKGILVALLQIAVEQEVAVMAQQPSVEEPPEKRPEPVPGTLAYWNRQLIPPDQHQTWPRIPVSTNGSGSGSVTGDFNDFFFSG